MAHFKEFRKGFQSGENAPGGGGDMHASALDHDFVSTLGGGKSPADPWERIGPWLEESGFGTGTIDAAAGLTGAWLKKGAAKNVLEVGCGLGLATRRLSKDGFKVRALDDSPTLVARAKDNAKGATVETANLLDLPPGRYDALISVNNGFSRFTLEGQAEAFLEAAHAALKPKGLFSVVFFNREALDEEKLNKSFMEGPFNVEDGKLLIYDQWQGHPDGGDRFVWAPLFAVGDHGIDWVRRSIPYKFWRIDEVKAMLKAAGFEIESTVDAADGKSAPTKNSRRIEVRARAN